MNINESYDGRTWLKDWWVIVKNNFAIIKNKVEDITSDIAIINTQINNLDQEKQQKDFVVVCNVEYADKNTLTIANASASFSEIKKAIEDDLDVILKMVFVDTAQVYYARLETDEENGDQYYWSFWRKGIHYRICYDYSGIWYVYATGFATSADVDELHQKIDGEITDNINDKQIKDYVVTCNAKINAKTNTKNETITISNASASYSEIRTAYENGADVILKADFGDACFIYARIEEDVDGDYRWSFWYGDDTKCDVWCLSDNSWIGLIFDLATEEEIAIINTQIGDINTALENALNGGAS